MQKFSQIQYSLDRKTYESYALYIISFLRGGSSQNRKKKLFFFFCFIFILRVLKMCSQKDISLYNLF